MSAYAFDRTPAPARGPGRAQPHVIAQRGNAAEFPENTLPALRSALELGIKYVEFDVHLTADSVPVVANDHLLATTTDMGSDIFALRANDLAQVRACEPARFGNRFTDVGIPTLAQAAQLLAAYPAAIAFVDIQSASLQQYGSMHVIDRVSECLSAVRKQIVLIAADLRAVEYVRQRGNYRTGWILGEYTALSALKCDAVTPEFLVCAQHRLPQDASRLWRGPWRWIVSDVDSGPLALQLASRGASFVQTAEVRLLLRELRQLAKQRPANQN